MFVSVLSHASMLIKGAEGSVVVDPWLVGSCYWRSWWNYPKAAFDERELARVDAVVITHVHWDHWHGPTLRRFFRGKSVILADEPNTRSRKDLRALGFSDITLLRHGQSTRVGDLTLTLYQFGLFLNDSALVVDDGTTRILNANDAKIAGSALRDVCRRHGPFSLAFRSHSSANPRVRFRVLDQPDFVPDDREHYFRSFRLFMSVVRPAFAVPFASNHCHLHDDVFGLNGYVSNPAQLAAYLADNPLPSGVALKQMLPGASWSNESGFSSGGGDPYADLAAKLEAYRLEAQPALERYRRDESAVVLGQPAWNRLMTLLRRTPRLLRPRGTVLFCAYWPEGHSEAVMVDMRDATFREVAGPHEARPGTPMLRFPAIVMRDAIFKNMFHHAGISKRCDFVAAHAADMQRLVASFSTLERIELGVFPLRWEYSTRVMRAYLARWRELWVYAQAAWLTLVRKVPIYLAEEQILGATRPNRQ